MKYSPTWLFSLALLVTPLLAWAAINHPALWQDRLVMPYLTTTPLPNTPVHEIGTILSGEITGTRHLTAADNPVILKDVVTVKPGASLTVAGGTAIYARRFSSLNVQGQLEINGTPDQPVLLTSNEMNSEDQVWDGISVSAGGNANINHATLQFASPGLNCLAGGKTAISHSVIQAISLGVYAETADCLFTDSRIISTRDGIISRGSSPILANTTISALKEEFKTVNSK